MTNLQNRMNSGDSVHNASNFEIRGIERNCTDYHRQRDDRNYDVINKDKYKSI